MRISRSASSSRSAVLIPGRTASRSIPSVRATTRPARRMARICSGVLIWIPDPDFIGVPISPAGERPQRGERPLGDLLDRAGRIDADENSFVGVEGDQRRGLFLVDLETVPDRLLPVIVALEQLAAAGVADPLPGRRVEEDVPDA